MPEARTFLAIDLGVAEGCFTLGRFDGERLQVSDVYRFPNELVSYNGRRHWDMLGIWQQIRFGLDATDRFGGARIDALGVTGPSIDYALLAEGGTLLENPYYHEDPEAAEEMAAVLRHVSAETIYERTGVQCVPGNTLFQLCAAHQKTPRVLAAADHLLTIPDLVNCWLTGVIACEYTNATTTQFLSCHTRLWAWDLLRELGIPIHFLSQIVTPGAVLGRLKPGVTSSTALAHTIVVAPACNALASAVAAARCEGDAAFAIANGNAWFIGRETEEPVVTAAAREFGFSNEGGVLCTNRLIKRTESIDDSGWDELEAVTGRPVSSIQLIGDVRDRVPRNATRTFIRGPANATALGNMMIQMITYECIATLEEGRAIIERSESLARVESSEAAGSDA